MPQQLSIASTEYVRAYVRSTVGGVNADPTLDTVQMGFVAAPPSSSPGAAPTTYFDAIWEPNGPDAQGRWIASCLIGPAGGATLAAGRWWAWLKISDDPETPVLPVGILVVY